MSSGPQPPPKTGQSIEIILDNHKKILIDIYQDKP